MSQPSNLKTGLARRVKFSRRAGVALLLAVVVLAAAGANRVAISFEAGDLAAPAPYSLDVTLMDTTWAAIQIDGAQNVASVQP